MSDEDGQEFKYDFGILTENGPKDILAYLRASELHQHCSTCFSFTRCSRDEDYCDFEQCSCGMIFHKCKQFQHSQFCQNEPVPCLNSEYGCDRILPRGSLGTHLVECPSNVVMCKAEWNRWPVYTLERRRHIPFKQINPFATKGQLDYELALRDQRMLECLKNLPRRTKLSLRNCITRRFPAVPIPSNVLNLQREPKGSNENLVSVSNDAYIDAGDDLTYIGVRKKKQFEEQMQRWQDDLDARLKGKIIPPKYWEFPEMEKGNIHKHCAYCVDINCERSNELKPNYEDMACNIIPCREDCGAHFHNCKSSEHMLICPNYEPPDEYEWMFKGMISGKGRRDKTQKKQPKKDNIKDFKFMDRVWPEDKSELVQRKKNVIPKPPPPPTNLHVRCPLDIRLDTVTRLQTKPKAMYTFVCAQEFRRGEYGWHYKNIHNDIHGGLNNWLEQRCPLAVYGCGFSMRRMFPHNKNFTIVYSQGVESFGVTRPDIQIKTKKSSSSNPTAASQAKKIVSSSKKKPATKSELTLEDLPFEMLEQIFKFLDSFSLCNLSITCRYFREVCCSLLDSKGCVSLQWERNKDANGKYHWSIAYKRWFFSSALDPIKEWVFTSKEGAVSEHLKVCPYNIRVSHKPIPKNDERWERVLKALEVKMKAKRESEWFIK